MYEKIHLHKSCNNNLGSLIRTNTEITSGYRISTTSSSASNAISINTSTDRINFIVEISSTNYFSTQVQDTPKNLLLLFLRQEELLTVFLFWLLFFYSYCYYYCRLSIYNYLLCLSLYTLKKVFMCIKYALCIEIAHDCLRLLGSHGLKSLLYPGIHLALE